MNVKTYLEIKEKLNGDRQQFVCTLMEQEGDQAVVLYRLEHSWQIERLTLPKGTLSFGYFWIDKPFNAYHWLGAEGQSLGVYFNISDKTRFNQDQVHWRDLSIDLLVTPDGMFSWLDLEELPSHLDERLNRYIRAAKEQLQENYPLIIEKIQRRSNAFLPKALQIG